MKALQPARGGNSGKRDRVELTVGYVTQCVKQPDHLENPYLDMAETRPFFKAEHQESEVENLEKAKQHIGLWS